MRSIPPELIVPYHAQVEGQVKQPWVGSCNACRCKFYGAYARDMHMRSPKHQAMLARWMQACHMTNMQAPPTINFVV